MDRILGVFAKLPQPGSVKTRLAAAVGPEPAARLYEAFLKDFLPRLDCLPVELVLAYVPPEAHGYFRSIVPQRFRLEEQTGEGLGQRMAGFIERQFARGAGQAVLVGTDAPDLPIERIQQAFDELNRRDVVLGPCDDGGYYLVGTNRPIPEIFREIDWSTGRVLVETLRRIYQLTLRLAILEPWPDVDTIDDLVQLSARLNASLQREGDGALSHTQAVLRSLVDRL